MIMKNNWMLIIKNKIKGFHLVNLWQNFKFKFTNNNSFNNRLSNNKKKLLNLLQTDNNKIQHNHNKFIRINNI